MSRPRRTDLIRALLALLALPGSLAIAVPSPAQETGASRGLELRVDPEDGSPIIRLGSLLVGGDLESALHSGLPVRVHVVVELWKDRFFDGQEGRAEWRASVVYDPLDQRYRVRSASEAGVPANEEEGTTLGSLTAVRNQLQRSFTVPLRPTSEGNFYYMATVEVETLSLSDLEELQRWLQGDLAPAVGGEGDVEGAVGRGVGRLMVRMLGLPARRVRARTPTFPFEPRGEGPEHPSTPVRQPSVP